jgi:hypothetical protein
MATSKIKAQLHTLWGQAHGGHYDKARWTEFQQAVEAREDLLEELYHWLHDGPMDSWDKRTSFHERIGKLMEKPPIKYPRE